MKIERNFRWWIISRCSTVSKSQCNFGIEWELGERFQVLIQSLNRSSNETEKDTRNWMFDLLQLIKRLYWVNWSCEFCNLNYRQILVLKKQTIWLATHVRHFLSASCPSSLLFCSLWYWYISRSMSFVCCFSRLVHLSVRKKTACTTFNRYNQLLW